MGASQDTWSAHAHNIWYVTGDLREAALERTFVINPPSAAGRTQTTMSICMMGARGLRGLPSLGH